MADKKYTILYVDDEEYNLTTFKGIFRRDYNILTAQSGAEAIDLLRRHGTTTSATGTTSGNIDASGLETPDKAGGDSALGTIDLIITDQRMPEMTGIEFLATVIPEFPETLRMILTGFSDVEAIIAAINTGHVYRYITKPWDEKEMKMTLDGALEYRNLQMKNKELVKHLAGYNQRLEREVEKRTAELEESNHDLLSANGEIRRQIELLNEQAIDIQQKNDRLTLLNGELKKANQLKTEFLSIAVHDLKNPLQSIIGFSQLIGEGATPEEMQSMAQTILHSSQKMLSCVSDLLQTSAIDSGKITLNTVVADLVPLARFVIDRSLPQSLSKQQTIHTDFAPDCFAEIDYDRMREIMENLLSNAIKYSPAGKSIWVGISKQETVVHFSVRDEGQGLTDADKKKLFGRFERLSARPTGNETSTGLGLSIVKELAELHGGKVWAESEGKHHGATFTVELPAAAPAA